MDAKQKAIIENYIRAYNEFDVPGMTRDLHEQVHFQNISNGTVDTSTEGLDQFREQAESARQYFTERRQEISSWNVQGNHVMVGINYVGVLAIDLPNGMKAGDTLKLTGQSEFEFENDKIIKITDRS